MADYIYLLHTRLTPAQQVALEHVRDAARAHGMTIFLVGGAVRDLTTGSPIRDLDFALQGDATKLKNELVAAGGTLSGEDKTTHSLYFSFPGGVRLEVGATLSATYPKPGKPVYQDANILDDLRRRDFTANAMAISLNDGSLGLLMDPLNGVADLENRELRLVSSYGFIEDPSRMVRAVRFSARLGWQMEEKTRQRYETGKAEDYIAALNETQRKYELEEIFHEEDPLRVLRKLESEGWAKVLFPAWTSAKVNEAELDRLRDTIGQLESMGIYPDPSAAYFPLLTAKLAPKDVATLKESFARPGFAAAIDALDGATKAFASQLAAKTAAAPSDAWKLLFSAAPESVLWLAHTTKSAPLQARLQSFFGEWAQARHKIPYQLMQEMRITPALPEYDQLIETLFYAVMDGKLDSPEAAKAFLEPYSPPAAPPPVNLRRRPAKREPKAPKSRSKKEVAEVSTSSKGEVASIVANQDATPEKAAPVAAKKQEKATKNPVNAEASSVPLKVMNAPSSARKIAYSKPAAKTVAVKKPASSKQSAVAKKAVANKKTAVKSAPPKTSASKQKSGISAKKSPAKKVAVKVVLKKPAPKVTKTPTKKTSVKTKAASIQKSKPSSKPAAKKAAKAAKSSKKTSGKPRR